jgi:site-specific recombinase
MRRRSKNYRTFGDLSIAIPLGALIAFGYVSFNIKSVLEDIAGIPHRVQVIDKK